MSGTVECAECGNRARRRGICSRCFRFLSGFELNQSWNYVLVGMSEDK